MSNLGRILATLKMSSGGSGSGDMTKAVYDPQNIVGDAFDMENMTEGDTNKIFVESERIKLQGIQSGAQQNEDQYFEGTETATQGQFFVNLSNQSLFNGKQVNFYLNPGFTPGSNEIQLSIDGGVVYKPVFDVDGNPAVFGAQPLSGDYFKLFFNSTLDGWVIWIGERSLAITRGTGWAGETVVNNANVNDIQAIQISDLQDAVATGNAPARRNISNATPTAALTPGDGEVGYSFTVTDTETNDDSIIGPAGPTTGENTILLSENDSGYRIFGTFTIANSGGVFADATILFRLYNGDPNTTGVVIDSFSQTLAWQQVGTFSKELDYVVPSGQAPQTLFVTAEVTDGTVTINDGSLRVNSVFSPVAISTDSDKVLLANPGNESISGTATTQADANEEFVNSTVKNTGNEIIDGIKTFSSFLLTPSSAPTSDYQVANKKYVDDNAGGGLSFGTAIDGTSGTGLGINAGFSSQATGFTKLIELGDVNFNTNSNNNTIACFIETAHNSTTTRGNTGIQINQRQGTFASGNGAGIFINMLSNDASGGTGVYIKGNANINSNVNGLVLYELNNSQSGATTVQKIELGTSTQSHTGILINAKGASAGQKGLKIDLGTTGTGVPFEIAGTNATTDTAATGNSKYINMRIDGVNYRIEAKAV